MVLREIRFDGKTYTVEIEPEDGVQYTTEFFGTRVTDGSPAEIGALLVSTMDNPARYRCRGDELYVRARVVSSRAHPNPYAKGDRETAWCQPIRP